MKIETSELMTMRGAARAAGCSSQRVSQAVAGGELRSHPDQEGNQLVWVRDLEKWAAGRVFGTRGRPRK